MEEALKLDGQFIDPETGEVVTPEDYYKDKTIVIEDLPRIARRLRELAKQVQTVESYRDDEIRRISEICQAKIDRLRSSYDFLLGKSRDMVDAVGERKIEYPGLGSFRYKKGREVVDDTAYHELEEAMQKKLWSRHQLTFRKKTTVTPDKKAVKALLRDIAEGKMKDDLFEQSFSIVRKPDEFEFKEEE